MGNLKLKPGTEIGLIQIKKLIIMSKNIIICRDYSGITDTDNNFTMVVTAEEASGNF